MAIELVATPSVTAGGIFKRSFAVWMKNFVPFTILYALFQAPAEVLQLSGHGILKGHPSYAMILTQLLGNIAAGAMAYGVFMELRGQRTGLGQSIIVGLRRLLPVLGVALLVAAMVGLASAVVYGVPGLVLQLFLFVAVPAAVVEKLGLLGALRRSKQLTDDYKGTIFGAVALIFIAFYAVAAAVGLLVRWGVPGSSIANQQYHARTAIWIVRLVLGAWYSVAAAVAYHDLRVLKDGVGTEELARVFD